MIEFAWEFISLYQIMNYLVIFIVYEVLAEK